MPRTPARLSFTGQTDSNGNATLKIETLRAHHAAFVITAKCQGAASWEVDQNTDPILFGSGDKVLLGPIYAAPRDVITLLITNAQPNAAVQGSLNGVQADTAEELELLPGAPQVAGFTIGIVSGEFQVTDLKVTGLTGATDPSRYVGATVRGAPTSGTFLVGDFVIAQNGVIWVCNVAGTPGTWRRVDGWYDIGPVLVAGVPAADIATRFRLQAGSSVVTTVGNVATITYPTAFPSGVLTVVFAVGDASGVSLTQLQGILAGDTAAQFQVGCFTNLGAAVPNGSSVRINWLAVGY